MYKQIVLDLKSRENKERAHDSAKFHKYDSFKSYGLTTPKLRTLIRSYKKDFKELSNKAVFSLVEQLYKSGIEDELLIANALMKLRVDSIVPEKFPWLSDVLEFFMSWSTVDDFCTTVFPVIVCKYPQESVSLLKEFNNSPNFWKRRMSVVAFVRRIGESGKFTQDALRLCEPLLFDVEDLVQKGVGWCLKDIMRGDKESVLAYVKDLRRRGVSAVITLYAIRDLKGSERQDVLAIKKTINN